MTKPIDCERFLSLNTWSKQRRGSFTAINEVGFGFWMGCPA